MAFQFEAAQSPQMPHQRALWWIRATEQNITIGKLKQEEIVARPDFLAFAHLARDYQLSLAGDHGCHLSTNQLPHLD